LEKEGYRGVAEKARHTFMKIDDTTNIRGKRKTKQFVLKRGHKLIDKTDKQILLATDFNCKSKKIRWIYNEEVIEPKLETPKRPRLWWT